MWKRLFSRMRCKNGPREVKWAIVNYSKSLSPLKEWDVTYLVELKGYCLIKSSCRKIRHWIQKSTAPKWNNEMQKWIKITRNWPIGKMSLSIRSIREVTNFFWCSKFGTASLCCSTQSNLHLQITINFDSYNILLMRRH